MAHGLMKYVLCTIVISISIGISTAFTPTLGQTSLPRPYQAIDEDAVSTECQAALEALSKLQNLATSIPVIDSIGKPAAGILEGNFAWIGHYDQCMNITDFRYCTVQMQVNGSNVIPGVPKLVLPVSWGLCMPNECNETEIPNAIDMVTELVNISQYFHVNDVTGAVAVCAHEPPVPYGVGFILTVLFCSIVILVAVLGAIVETAQKKKFPSLFSSPFVLVSEHPLEQDEDADDEPLLDIQNKSAVNGEVTTTYVPPPSKNIASRLLQCFSLTSNLSKLLDSKQSDRSITCLNGIRVISMMWVILGHTFIFSFNVYTDNPLVGIAFTKRFGFQAMVNAFFSVDTFFFLSGFLLGFLTLSRMAKTNGKIPWLWFYLHRFLRLTPVYMFTILVHMYLAPHFGEGPLWQPHTFKPYCPKYWWTNLLYINNFYPKNFTDECIAWTWYLANDMQFFIVSPIFLISLFMFPVVGLVLLTASLFASFIVTGTLIGYYNLNVAIAFAGGNVNVAGSGGEPPLDYFSLVYGKPYCRIAPYLVGIALGYIMYKIGNRKVKMNPVVSAGGWAIASGLALTVVYGLYPSYHDGYTLSTVANIIYGTFSRFVWAIALAWVVFACKYGYGGWVNDFLSWNGWVVFSRLTYTAYLVHPIVINTFYFNFGAPVHASLVLFSFYFVGCLGIAYGMAAIFSLVIEFPFANMEKLMMPSDVQSKRTVNVSNKQTTVQ